MDVRVSVAMVVYNATWCVERALTSVLAQTRPAHEVLLCDDGSTDGTPELVESRFGDAVRVLRLPHRNASATRRIGTERATGNWLAFVDADDVWHPEKLERQVRFLERHPEVRWMGTDGRLVSAEGVLRESWLSDYFDPVRDLAGDLRPLLVERCFTLMSSMLMERDAYFEVGGLDPEIVYSHDYDLWLRLAARYPGGILAERLIDYWTGPGTLSRHFEARDRDDLLIMRKVEQGRMGRMPWLQRKGAERAAALEFELGLMALRSGRIAEARDHFRRAARRGPWRRRALSLGAAMLPTRLFTRLMRSPWAKGTVQRVRRTPKRMTLAGTPEAGT